MWWTAHFEPQWVVSLLPPQSSTALEVVLDLVDADLAARDPVPLIAASRSDDEAPLAWLPYLADERSADEFSGSWPEARQRAVIAQSLPIHQAKGSRPAIDRVMTSMGYRVRVVEWFEAVTPRTPNTFRLAVAIDADREWYDTDNLALIRAANKAKNLHTKLEFLEPSRRIDHAAVYVGGIPRYSEIVRIGNLPEIETMRLTATVYVGAAIRSIQTLRIQPRT